MTKKSYITPMAEAVTIPTEQKLMQMASENVTKTGTGQEGTGESGGKVPGTGGVSDPGEDEEERNAKGFNLWDAWD